MSISKTDEAIAKPCPKTDAVAPGHPEAKPSQAREGTAPRTPVSSISASDIKILRELGYRKSEIGHMPVQAERFDLWHRLNRLETVRPLIFINEMPWHELQHEEPLQLRCQSDTARAIETDLRRELYQWDFFPGDMIIEPLIYAEVEAGPRGSYADFGIQESRVSHAGALDYGFRPVILTEADADRIRTPEIWHDREAGDRRQALLSEIFDGILPVRSRGIVHQWYAPWDRIIRWYGIEQLYADMYDRPALVHRIVGNFMRAQHELLDRQEALGMLDTGNWNHRIGSGGLGITDELPPADFDPNHVRPCDQWGCSTGQIFSEVSPAMHEEFCLQYERPMLARFGLSYYGCCEPLDRKMDILRSITNLRKVSMSPWIDMDLASEQIAADYVFSFKPNPALLASETWDPEAVRRYLRNAIDKTRRNRVELVLKDISTIRNQPHRLREWAAIAAEESLRAFG